MRQVMDHSEHEKKILTQRAELLAQSRSDSYDNDNNILLSFAIGNEKYAISNNQIYKVIPLQTITKLPMIPDEFVGVVYHSGNAWPVVDAGYLYQNKSIEQPQNIILLEQEDIRMALLVNDIINQVTYHDESAIKDVVLATKLNLDSIKGIINNDVAVIDADKLFDWINQLVMTESLGE